MHVLNDIVLGCGVGLLCAVLNDTVTNTSVVDACINVTVVATTIGSFLTVLSAVDMLYEMYQMRFV